MNEKEKCSFEQLKKGILLESHRKSTGKNKTMNVIRNIRDP